MAPRCVTVIQSMLMNDTHLMTYFLLTSFGGLISYIHQGGGLKHLEGTPNLLESCTLLFQDQP